MDYSDTQSLHTLNDDKIARLVAIAPEEFGTTLTCTQFNEAMLALFENIAGPETLPRKRSQQ